MGKKRSHKSRKKQKKIKVSKKIVHKKKIIKKKIKHKTHHSKQVKKTIKRKIERVSTGIQNLDHLAESGFKKYSTNIVVGGSGSGKTIFAVQFLVEGMKSGENCLYVTFEEKKEQFYSNMLKIGFDLEPYEKKGLLTFLEYSPSKVKTMLEEGGGSIETVIVNKKISRMVIDSITSFALLFKDEMSKREAALALFSTIKRWSCTSLLTLEQEPSAAKEVTSKSLEFESDSIIILYFVREKKKRQRYIEILKMRGTNHSTDIHKFSIGKKGIKVERRASSSPVL